MKMRPITAQADREEFSYQWKAMTGMAPAAAYFEAMHLYGFFVDEKMVGGFGLAYGQDMAWPVLSDKNFFLEKDIDIKDCLEVNLFWVKPFHRRRAIDSIRIWWKIGKLMTKQNVQYVTFACEDIPAKATLMKRYDIICSGLLYNGPITKYEGRRMKVWWAPPVKFHYAHFLFIKEYLRLFRRDLARDKAKVLNASSIGETK